MHHEQQPIEDSSDDQSGTVAIDMNMMRSKTVSSVEYAELRRGMWKGEWDVVYQFLEKYPINTILEEGYEKGTVLHLAISAGQAEISKKLVKMMSTTDLQIQNDIGGTALYVAASKNLISLAKCLVQKHPGLLVISGQCGLIPVTKAATYGYREMTCYLYSVTPLDVLQPENGDHGFNLMCTCISNKMFDISLDLLRHIPHLAMSFTRDGKQSHIPPMPMSFPRDGKQSHIPPMPMSFPRDGKQSPIFRLSTEPSAFYSGSRLSFWQRWIYHLIKVKLPSTHQSHGTAEKFGIKGIQEIYDLKLNHYHALQILRSMCNYISTLNDKQLINCGIYDAVSEATKRGTYEFLIELFRAVPSLVVIFNKEKRNVLTLAIQHRQEKVFNLFCGISETIMVECTTVVDYSRNNILHVAGRLPPPISPLPFPQVSGTGTTLQMQRELQWFKEVEKITPPCYKEAKNNFGQTPRQVFTMSHVQLLKNGEKWAKDTAKSFTIVGTLVVTIMLVVAFTISRGNNQNTGLPIFLGEKAFKIFLISGAVSFFAASTSILMFLGILTSRYAEDDFLLSLPTKLIIGLSTLFISTAAMMVSFSGTLVIMLRGQWWTITPILVMANISVTLFVWLQFPLLVEIFKSTYGRGIFGKKVKVEPQ